MQPTTFGSVQPQALAVVETVCQLGGAVARCNPATDSGTFGAYRPTATGRFNAFVV